MSYFHIEDQFGLNVSRGKVRGAYKVTKFGSNSSVGTSMETVWDGGGLYPWDEFDNAGTVTITSSSSQDDVSGNGARQIKIEGLDNDYNNISDTLDTNGTGNTTSSLEFKRIFRAYVVSSGSSDTNVGTISVNRNGTTVAQIRVEGGQGLGQTFMSTYTVPVGYTAYLYSWNNSTAKAYNLSADADIYLVQREYGEDSWRSQDIIHSNANSIERDYKLPLRFEEKTDIEVRGYGSSSGISISSTYQILLVKEA